MTGAMQRMAVALSGADEALRLGGASVGGKALSLAKLCAAGERVPAWVVIPAEVLESHLRSAGVLATVERELRALDEPAFPRASASTTDGDPAAARNVITLAASTLQAIVDAMPLDETLVGALADAATRLGGGRFAVRSSAIGEDGERFSFAGQLDTVLGVSAEQLGDTVRRCWRSAFSPRVLDYRRRTGSLPDAPRLAVIVQRLVLGDVSGVLFTLDPVTGDRRRMRVSACRGVGEALVSGTVDADEYVIARDGTELETRLLAAAARLVEPDGLRELAAIGRRIEEREGKASDIEWTIRAGEVWVLQARPITTAARVEETSNRIVWDNSNIQESYCGVTTPLTFSFARAAYASVYEQTMRALGVPEATIAEHRPMLRTLLGLLRGRVYYNLNSWYRGLLLFPAFHRNKADMERMMGVEEPVDFVTDETLGVADHLRRVPRLARTLAGLLAAFATLERDTTRFLERFDARMRHIDRGSLHGCSLGQLMEIIERIRVECIERWTIPIINDFQVMMSTGRLRRLVERALAGGEEPERLMQTLLGGADVAISAGPAMLMLRLAQLARGDAGVLAALLGREGEGGEALAAARSASPAFARASDELLVRYGDRCMGELKLESRSLRDDPAFVVRMLRNYLNGHAADPERLAAAARKTREVAERAVSERLGPFARVRFRRALVAARRGIRRRETMRLARTRMFGAHRDVYRAIGTRLHEMGRLDRPEDVLYLTTDEIRAFWEGTGASADLAPIARERRAEFAAYERERVPNRIVTTGAPHESLRSLAPSEPGTSAALDDAAAGEGGRVFRGLGCSAGVAEGIVRVVRSVDDDLAIDGHILVATRTDPGWAPLFPSARAIVVERGSLLSHSAVLARELGLPAVVGLPGIVETLRDGERVRVDGTAGTVERLDARCES